MFVGGSTDTDVSVGSGSGVFVASSAGGAVGFAADSSAGTASASVAGALAISFVVGPVAEQAVKSASSKIAMLIGHALCRRTLLFC